MKFVSFLIILVCVAVVSCGQQQSQSSITEAEVSTENSDTKVSKEESSALCGSVPIVKNKQKLEQSLTRKGLINEQMSPEEKDQVIRDYIRQKNENYQKCLKGKK